MTKHLSTLAAIVALSLPIAALAACSTATRPPAAPPSAGPAGDPATPSAPATDAPAPIPDEFFDQVAAVRAQFDAWHDDWSSSGCTDVTASTGGDAACASILAGGAILATNADILFTSIGVTDYLAYPDLADLDPARSGAMYAAWRGESWNEAGCASEPSAACADLTWNLVDDLQFLHDGFAAWSR